MNNLGSLKATSKSYYPKFKDKTNKSEIKKKEDTNKLDTEISTQITATHVIKLIK